MRHCLPRCLHSETLLSHLKFGLYEVYKNKMLNEFHVSFIGATYSTNCTLIHHCNYTHNVLNTLSQYYRIPAMAEDKYTVVNFI
jgi:hypothetical protein